MFLSQAIAQNLLLLLLLQPSLGFVLNTAQAQAPVPLDVGDSRSSVRFADDDDYLDTAGFSEAVGEQRGARASLLPNFGRPLDRIFSEKRLIHGDRPAPRRRILTPLDHIGGPSLLHRRVWLDDPEAEWNLDGDELNGRLTDWE